MPLPQILHQSEPPPGGTGNAPPAEEDIYDVLESSEPAVPPNPQLATKSRLNILLMKSRTCPQCGYDLRGIPGDICPECGTEYDEAAEARRRQQEDWNWVAALKFMFLGTIPMFIWFPGAFALVKYTGLFGRGMAIGLGIALWMIPTIVAGRLALDECDDIEGIFLAGFIMTIIALICGVLFWLVFAMQ